MQTLFLSLHLIAVICWFAGLFYLPRLFVYHSMTKKNAVFDQLKVMEYKLYYFIMHPALLLTLLTGGGLVWGYVHANPNLLSSSLSFWVKNWLVWKLFLVLLLILFHLRCGRYLKAFQHAKGPKEFSHSPLYRSHRFFRIWNEIPTVILIIVVFLVVYKP